MACPWGTSSPLDRYPTTSRRPANEEKLKTPTSVTDGYWLYVDGPQEESKVYGKWLVFGNKKNGQLDSLWCKIYPLVVSGELGAKGVKSSTGKESPTASNPNTGVICVYTSRESADAVGMKLVHVVQQTIKYKPDEATFQGKYAVTGYKNQCEKTIYWTKKEGKARLVDHTRKD